MAYPVFLLLLTIPALEWLLARDKPETEAVTGPLEEVKDEQHTWEAFRRRVGERLPPRLVRLGVLSVLLVFTAFEAYRFQVVFRNNGPNRQFDFDVAYKTVYDAATKQPVRPIYLEDGKWGPSYIHALWYSTIEKRPRSEFVHLAPGVKAPAGKLVISSAEGCQQCDPVTSAGVYQLYRAR